MALRPSRLAMLTAFATLAHRGEVPRGPSRPAPAPAPAPDVSRIRCGGGRQVQGFPAGVPAAPRARKGRNYARGRYGG